MFEFGEHRCEALGDRTVRVGVGTDGDFERPRIETERGAFLGEIDVVQVGECERQPFAGTVAGLVVESLASARFGCFRLLRFAFPAERDEGAMPAPDEFDRSTLRRGVGDGAVGAQAAGASGDGIGDPRVLPVGAQDATFNQMDVAHRVEGTPLPIGLDEIAERIYTRIDEMVFDVGRELQAAFEAFPAEYERWVTDCLPFGLDKARRLRMIWKASRVLPPEILEKMPRAWQALYAVTRLPATEVVAAVESGAIGPSTSVRDAIAYARPPTSGGQRHPFSAVDIVAGKLMGHPPQALSVGVRRDLRRWLASADRDAALVDVTAC